MSQPVRRTPRPLGVSFLVVLGVIQGVVGALVGLFVLLDRNDAELVLYSRMTPNQLFFVGLLAIVFGLVVVYLSLVLGSGSEMVRLLFGLFTVVQLSAGLWALVALQGEQRYGGAWQLVFSGVVLWILFGSEQSKHYFQDH